MTITSTPPEVRPARRVLRAGLLGLVAPLLAPYLRRKVAARALDGLAATLQ